MSPGPDDGDAGNGNPGNGVAADGASFIERWSRRKREQLKPAPGRSALEPSSGSADPVAGGTAAPTVTAADPDAPLPSVDDLTETSDLTAFLEKRVPEELRRLAMRKMWALDPQIRDFIEMAENQYDWNTPGGVPGYGDLNPGTDIETLLAQAIGSGPKEPLSVEPGSTITMAELELEPGVELASLDDASPQAVQRTEEVATDPATPVNTSQIREDEPASERNATFNTDDQQAIKVQRRHGRALPL
ncbi:MAG: DUF3306 domain-containing protein [Hyphomicrobiaceae bacterium]|nr:DUF3306 domain-containing protein [Hyphomicrobiaceae bacterium]